MLLTITTIITEECQTITIWECQLEECQDMECHNKEECLAIPHKECHNHIHNKECIHPPVECQAILHKEYHHNILLQQECHTERHLWAILLHNQLALDSECLLELVEYK